MTRVIGLFGFAGAFLMISPDLRQTVLAGINAAAVFVEQYSPYTYMAGVLLAFGGVTVSLRAGQGAR